SVTVVVSRTGVRTFARYEFPGVCIPATVEIITIAADDLSDREHHAFLVEDRAQLPLESSLLAVVLGFSLDVKNLGRKQLSGVRVIAVVQEHSVRAISGKDGSAAIAKLANECRDERVRGSDGERGRHGLPVGT